MLSSIRVVLRRASRRVAVLCAVIALGVAVTAAHSSVGDEHMGEAVAMCLAVLIVGGAAVASLPALGRWIPQPPRPLDARAPTLAAVPAYDEARRARGDPPFLQVFRN